MTLKKAVEFYPDKTAVIDDAPQTLELAGTVGKKRQKG